MSDTLPTHAHATSVGDISNPGANVANIGGADWNHTFDGNVTTVGAAGPLSTSFYGTFDQTGNVWELSLHSLVNGNISTVRGGEWSTTINQILPLPTSMVDSGDQLFFAAFGDVDRASSPDSGFRMASIPEPNSFVLAAFGLAAMLFHRLRVGRVCR